MNRKYITVIICCCLYIGACTGTGNALGAFIIPMAQQTNSLRGTVSLASTIYGIVSGLCAPFLIWAIRKYPLKYIMLITATLTALLTCSFGYMNNVYVYLAANIFKGLLNAIFSSTIIVIIIGNWFTDAKSTITALALGFSGIAGAIYSPLFTSIINSYGLRTGYFVEAFFQFVLVLPAAFFLTVTPQEKNLEPYRSSKSPIGKTESADADGNYEFKVRDPMFYSLCAVSVLSAILFHVSNHFNGYALTLNKGSIGPLMASAIMIGNILFKFVAGYICDHYGNRYGVSFLCVTGIVGCLIILFGSSSDLLLLAGAFMIGVVYANQITTSALIRHIYGNKQYADVFAAQSVPYGLMYFGNMLFGYIYDFTQSYRLCFIFGIAILLITLLLNWLMLRKAEAVNH